MYTSLPGKGDTFGFGKVDEDRLFGDEDETFFQEV